MTVPSSTNNSAPAGRLVLSFDLGTTQSAVAVAYLRPGQPDLVDVVDKWDEHKMYLERVPTAVLYDENGTLLGCGAEAIALAEQEEHREAARTWPEHFKMKLHPNRDLPTKRSYFRRDSDRGLSRIYTDFLRYLLQRTQEFLLERTGRDVWSDFPGRAEIVLSHPNRWGADQQKFLESVAIQAGLVTRDGARRYLHFVEETEAAACFSLTDRTLYSLMRTGTKFVICDAGGSTVDISAYTVTNRGDARLDVEELDVPSCLDAGGVHVDKEFGMHIYDQLYTQPDIRDLGVQYAHDIVEDGLKHFQDFGKCRFSSPTDSLEVRFGRRRMNYPSLNITRGVMNIPGPIADTFFQRFVQQAVEEVARRVEKHGLNIIIFSGGFADSPYFRLAMSNRLEQPGRTITTVNHPVSKAVAVGSLMLVVGGGPSMTVVRNTRPWAMWLTDFRRGLREFFGNNNNQPL